MTPSLFATLHRACAEPRTLLTRRELLRASLASSAGLLLSACASARRAPDSARPRVIVVGAGLAGLSAAHELAAARCDVSVLEARARVGGRVLSLPNFVPGRNVEAGAELIGANHPAWIAYAHQFGLELLPVSEDKDALDPIVIDGKKLDFKAATALWESMKQALNQMNELARPVDADAPWSTPGAADLDARSIQSWIDALDADPLTKRACWINQASDNAVHPARASLLAQLAAVKGGGLEKFWTDTEAFRCRNGNQQLAARFAQELGHSRLALNSPVTEIDSSPDRANCRVRLADGRELVCDHVVLAIPPSLWPSCRFVPPLPPQLSPQMGTASKYLAHVKNRFWKQSGLSPYALSDLAIEQTWDGTDGQPGDGPACLVGFSGGPGAIEAGSWDAAARDQRFAEILTQFYPQFPGNLVEGRFMDWPNSPWTRAGYSFPAPGQVTTIGPLLSRGIGRLHFAGEHCCPAFVGYMEGALQSGISVARRIVDVANPMRTVLAGPRAAGRP